jgi:hypothetical protein
MLIEADPVASVDVAVQAATLRGIYSGSLLYEDTSLGRVPVTLWLEDPSSRLSAVVNPTLLSSRQNAFDDDGDLEIDELDEGTGLIIPTRTTAGFPSETVLVGEISRDGQRLRLRGSGTGLPELEFASGQDGGLASAFVSSSRVLSLEAERSDSDAFEGFFSDRYQNVSLGGGGEVSRSGRFSLRRIAGPSCVLPIDYSDPLVSNDDRPVPVDIDCRSDADCPGRCTGAPEIEGFFCTRDDECRGNIVAGVFDPNEGAVVPTSQGFVTGTCERLTCAFAEFVPGSRSADALHFEEARISIAGLDRIAVVRLTGPETRSFVLDTTNGSGLDVGPLACGGEYTVQVTASGCDAVSSLTFDPCSDPAILVEELAIEALNCPDAAVTGDEFVVASTGGSYTLIGGPVVGGEVGAIGGIPPDEIGLLGSGGEVARGAALFDSRWSNVMSWPSTEVVLRAGLEEVLR